MKTKSITKITLIVMAGALLALNSCQKEKPLTTQTDEDLGTSALGASQLVIRSLQNTSNSFKQEESLLAGCATVTMDTVTKPHTYTVDYGTGCTNSNGVTQSGKVIVTYDDANIRTANNTFVTSFQNYSNGGEQVSGSITLRNNGLNGSGNVYYTMTLALQTTKAGVTNPINGNLGYEWIAGESTQTNSDDKFSLTGSVNGGTNKHTGAIGTITSPLISSAACSNFYVQGTMVYTQTGKPTKTLDYGNGTCTGMVTTTVSGVSTTTPQNQKALGLGL